MAKYKIKNLHRRKCLKINKKESEKKFLEQEIQEFYATLAFDDERRRIRKIQSSIRAIKFQERISCIKKIDQFQNFPKTTKYFLSEKDFQEKVFSYVMKKPNFLYSKTIRLGIEFGWDLTEIEKNLELIHIGIENSRVFLTDERKQKCLICLQEKNIFYGLACNHKFCEDCYKIYLRNFLEIIENHEKTDIFELKCPEKSCKVCKNYFIFMFI